MGLCPSTAAFRNLSPNRTTANGPDRIAQFSVVNVDEFGNNGSKGIIEVSNGGILLRRRHTSDVFWPLRSLRRYGHNEELFTFESGRQCETGPGVFAFRLKKSHKLFNLVKSIIESEAQALENETRYISEVMVSVDSSIASPMSSTASPMSPPSSLHLLPRMPNGCTSNGSTKNPHETPSSRSHLEVLDNTPQMKTPVDSPSTRQPLVCGFFAKVFHSNFFLFFCILAISKSSTSIESLSIILRESPIKSTKTRGICFNL